MMPSKEVRRGLLGSTGAVVAIAAAIGGCVRPTGQAPVHIPSTVSAVAQQALRETDLSMRELELPAADDFDSWAQIQRDNEAQQKDANDKVVDMFQPSIERTELGGVEVLDIKPMYWRKTPNVLVYTHGGTYTSYSADSTLTSAVPVAHDTGLRVISVNYVLAPFSKFQETTDQVIDVIEALLRDDRTLENVAIYGDSAGGSLAVGTVLKMRDQGLGMPAAVVLWSPWSDITETGDTYVTLKDADPMLSYSKALSASANAYADPDDQRHPYVSPVYADYGKGFPPTLIQGGTREIFLSNFIRQYQALDQAGIPVKLDLYEGMWHVFQAFNYDLPESKLARKKMGEFLRLHLGG